MIVAGDDGRVRAGIDDVGIARIGRDVAALAAAHFVPVLAGDDAVVGPAGDGDGGVVLLRAVDAVGPLVVGGDVIELRGGLVVLLGPGLAAVDGDGDAAVVAVDQALRIGGIDPQAVMIAVRRGQQVERSCRRHWSGTRRCSARRPCRPVLGSAKMWVKYQARWR